MGRLLLSPVLGVRLRSTLKAKPRLYIHRDSAVKKPTFNKMIGFIGLKSMPPKSVSYPNTADSSDWLRTNVYSANKKEDQKKNLFAKMVSEESLKEFVEEFDIIHQPDINQYKKELMKALAKAYPSPDKDGDEEHWQLILLGLAISYKIGRAHV